jgi:DnaJ homolog subfamily B member 4
MSDELTKMFAELLGGRGNPDLGNPNLASLFNSALGSTRSPPQIVELEFGVKLTDFYCGAQKKARLTYDDTARNQVVEFDVQPGWREGVKITFQQKAWDSAAACHTDLILILKEKADTRFQRRTETFPDLIDSRPENEKLADLVHFLTITINEAVRGFQKLIEHMDGHNVLVEFDGTDATDQKEIIVVGEGMPIRKSGKIVGKGDLYIQLDVKI